MSKLSSVRVKSTRYGTFELHYQNPDGRRRRLSVETNEQLAQRQAIKFNDWLLEGKDPETELQLIREREKARNVTLRSFFLTFMKRHGSQQSKSMQTNYRYYFKAIERCPVLVDCAIGSVTKALVLQYMHARMDQDRVKAATVNREAALISVMLSCTVEWGLLDANPLLRMKKPKESGKREVCISQERIIALLNALPSGLADAVEFAIYSGFRRENVLGLRIEQVRFCDAEKTVEIRLVVKGRNSKIIVLGGPAVLLLCRVIGTRTEGYVFRKPGTEERYSDYGLASFRRAVRKLGFTVKMDGEDTPFRFHDLRHLTATWGHDAGIPRERMQVVLGHRSKAMTDNYTTDNQLEAARSLEALPLLRKAL